VRTYATAQLIGDRSHQCDATAVSTAPSGARAYALLDGIGSSDEIRDWTRTAARRLARTAARRGDAEAGVPTAILPDLIQALTDRETWEDNTLIAGALFVRPDVSGVAVTVTEIHSVERQEEVFASLPEAQRLPFASALCRALDVAKGWED